MSKTSVSAKSHRNGLHRHKAERYERGLLLGRGSRLGRWNLLPKSGAANCPFPAFRYRKGCATTSWTFCRPFWRGSKKLSMIYVPSLAKAFNPDVWTAQYHRKTLSHALGDQNTLHYSFLFCIGGCQFIRKCALFGTASPGSEGLNLVCLSIEKQAEGRFWLATFGLMRVRECLHSARPEEGAKNWLLVHFQKPLNRNILHW
jgi:hypothetical protein